MTDQAVSAKINLIRAQQLHDIAECVTCGRAAGAPYRSWDGDKIVQGCIDSFHTGRLVTPSASASWHTRPEAKALRRSTLKNLQAVR